MGGKYASPKVELRDIAACLPPVLPPLFWRVGLYPKAGQTTALYPSVELCAMRPDSSAVVYRRWDGAGRSPGTEATLAGLLRAAQEAAWWMELMDEATVRALVCWQVDVPRP